MNIQVTTVYSWPIWGYAPHLQPYVHHSWTKYHVRQIIQLSPRYASSIQSILRRGGSLCIWELHQCLDSDSWTMNYLAFIGYKKGTTDKGGLSLNLKSCCLLESSNLMHKSKGWKNLHKWIINFQDDIAKVNLNNGTQTRISAYRWGNSSLTQTKNLRD